MVGVLNCIIYEIISTANVDYIIIICNKNNSYNFLLISDDRIFLKPTPDIQKQPVLEDVVQGAATTETEMTERYLFVVFTFISISLSLIFSQFLHSVTFCDIEFSFVMNLHILVHDCKYDTCLNVINIWGFVNWIACE